MLSKPFAGHTAQPTITDIQTRERKRELKIDNSFERMLNFQGKVALTVSQQKSFIVVSKATGFVFCVGAIMINHWLLPTSFLNAFTQLY